MLISSAMEAKAAKAAKATIKRKGVRANSAAKHQAAMSTKRSLTVHNAHYRKWQANNSSDTRSKLRKRSEKPPEFRSMKKVIKKAKAMGARQERRKSVASAVADSDDKEEVDALEKEISELEAKKAAALESEDYDEAKNIKDKIDTLAEKMDNE